MGNELTYDYFGQDTTTNALIIGFSEGSKLLKTMRVEETYSEFNDGSSVMGIYTPFKVARKEDGLHAGKACGGFLPSGTDYLFLPAAPTLGASFPYINCGTDTLGTKLVIGINTLITVPAGTFSTTHLEDTANYQHEYWNEKEGLIRIDHLAYKSDSVTSSFQLSSKNF